MTVTKRRHLTVMPS